MDAETEECPCFMYDLDEGAKAPNTCYCGDRKDEHDAGGNCRSLHRTDEPYNPELTEAALRLAKRWMRE